MFSKKKFHFFIDVFQSFLMFGSIISVIIAGSVHVGSIGTALAIAAKGDRLHLFDFDPVN